MSTNELTLLFTFVDDFFQALFHAPFGKKLRHLWENKRGRQKKLTLSEVVTLNLLRFYMRVQDLKTFHRIISEHYKRYFPQAAELRELPEGDEPLGIVHQPAGEVCVAYEQPRQ
jgi:hypothetical protein